MWPWGHLGLGYLAYVATRRASGRRPRGRPALAAVIGSQLPDLVDKPLAWWLSVLPTGRSLAHSIPIVTVAVTVVALVALTVRRSDRAVLPQWSDRTELPGTPTGAATPIAFGVAYATHLFGDALYPLVRGEFHDLRFLLWPFVPPAEIEIGQSLAAHAALIEPSPELALELALFVAATIVWYRDGRPGLDLLRTQIRGAVSWLDPVSE